GTVTDAQTGDPIPFANVILKGSHEGTITNSVGKFSIETTLVSDSIQCMFIGYITQAKKIYPHKFQVINFSLQPEVVTLNAVTIKSKKRGKNFADTLMNKIRKHRKENDINYLDAYQYETYNKIEFDINNITEDFKNKKTFKKFKFIWNYVDTSTVNGTVYLPFLLIESVSDYYYRKSPKKELEIVKASKISGISNESINQFMGNMYIKINVWNSYIDLFGKGFISPIAKIGQLYYKYYLLDSVKQTHSTMYHIGFRPILKQDYVFNGDFWVNGQTFGITKLNFSISPHVNLNFINNLKIYQEFSPVGEINMLKKEKLVVDFNLFENPKKSMGFFGRKTTIYRKRIINQPKPENFYNTTNNIIVSNEILATKKQFWDTIRPEALSKHEKQIYTMVDSIKSMPIFQTYYDIVNTIFTGHYVWGKIELGPYYKTMSNNQVEGWRLRLGGRTSNDFSTKLMLGGYIAYGFTDKRFKGSGDILYLFNTNPRRSFKISAKHDLEQLGQSRNALTEDNILSSILRRIPNNKLSMTDEIKASYEHEWFQGLSNTITLNHRDLYSPSGTNYVYSDGKNDIIKSDILTTDITLKTRFAYHEKFVMGKFIRISLGTNYPIIETYLTLGIKNWWQSDFTYKKLEFFIKHYINLYPFGYSKYMITGGKIWGTLPYPLLKLHEGNETYLLDNMSFNLMNYYEFVSDQYISLYYSHFFDGFFLNKIPIFKKLKWREVIWAKGVIGSLSDNNRNLMEYPSTLYSFNDANNNSIIKPYWEAGIGIENIFKFIRVDGVWRLSYLNHPNISRFGIRINLTLKF
ncbi:MAG TPA: carboxypeptidase-like regulatory domain-containing protein, partial [Bacteroidales bacterium]|nr:carboxypeptidase-like regulatory domain-containing protein [Bacteroidales bacterium]